MPEVNGVELKSPPVSAPKAAVTSRRKVHDIIQGAAEGAQGTPPRTSWLRMAWTMVSPVAGQLAWVVGLGVASVGLQLVQPLIARRIIDGLIPGSGGAPRLDLGELTRWGGVALALLVSALVLDLVRGSRMQVLNAKMVARTRLRLFKHLLWLPMSDIKSAGIGRLVANLTRDAEAMSGLLDRMFVIPTVESIRVVLMFGIVCWVNWPLAVFSAFMGLLMVGGSRAIMGRLRTIHGKLHEENAATSSWLTEIIGGIRVLRVFGQERRAFRQYAVRNHTLARVGVYVGLRQVVFEGCLLFLIPLSLLSLVFVGGALVLKGWATLGDVTAIMLYLPLMLEPVFRIITAITNVQAGAAASERVNGFLAANLEDPRTGATLAPPWKIASLRLENVSFQYEPEAFALSGIELAAAAGERIAIVGRSGSGKTTLTNLLAGLYVPTSGRILINGVDAQGLGRAGHRSLVSLVEQETFLFDGTIRDNIAFGAGNPSPAAVAEAATEAALHAHIAQLPKEYDTPIGERGFQLSGGQRQRLAIARALLRRAPLLILDEATSQLDSEAEEQIKQTLRGLPASIITFVVAHRLSTISDCSRVVVLEAGRIVECGGQRELMAARGVFWKMVQQQQLL